MLTPEENEAHDAILAAVAKLTDPLQQFNTIATLVAHYVMSQKKEHRDKIFRMVIGAVQHVMNDGGTPPWELN